MFGRRHSEQQAEDECFPLLPRNLPTHAQVPVPHFGVCLTVPAFHKLARKLERAKVPFIVEPHLRFPGAPGEQYTMFFKDLSGNSLEFKALTNPANLFAKYVV